MVFFMLSSTVAAGWASEIFFFGTQMTTPESHPSRRIYANNMRDRETEYGCSCIVRQVPTTVLYSWLHRRLSC